MNRCEDVRLLDERKHKSLLAEIFNRCPKVIDNGVVNYDKAVVKGRCGLHYERTMLGFESMAERLDLRRDGRLGKDIDLDAVRWQDV